MIRLHTALGFDDLDKFDMQRLLREEGVKALVIVSVRYWYGSSLSACTHYRGCHGYNCCQNAQGRPAFSLFFATLLILQSAACFTGRYSSILPAAGCYALEQTNKRK